jgi:Ribonuclease G/E
LDEFEKCGIIETIRQRDKSSIVTVLCEDCYEGYPT